MKYNQMNILPGKIFISLVILVAAGVITFSPVIKNSFTNWDDQAQLLENPLVRELSVRNLRKIFITPVVSEYHPLVWESLWASLSLTKRIFIFVGVFLGICSLLAPAASPELALALARRGMTMLPFYLGVTFFVGSALSGSWQFIDQHLK